MEHAGKLDVAIFITARWGSERFPGKPLAKIGNQSLVQIGYEKALKVADPKNIYVLTEDERVLEHCREHGMNGYITPSNFDSGCDRASWFVRQEPGREFPDRCVVMSVDSLTVDEAMIRSVAVASEDHKEAMLTPVVELDQEGIQEIRGLREAGSRTGTFAIVALDKVLWMSKRPNPSFERYDTLEEKPLYHRHVGLYGFSYQGLYRFNLLRRGPYEADEKLESLRMLENARPVICRKFPPRKCLSVNTPEELEQARSFLGLSEAILEIGKMAQDRKDVLAQ